MKVGIIGTGVYGMAVALQLAKKCDSVIMWSESEERVLEFRKNHKIKGILDGINIPNNITITSSYEDTVKDAEVVFILSVAKFTKKICDDIKPILKKDTPICIASKGIENESCALLSDIVMQVLETENVAVLSGPTFAIDMANNDPCALTVASKSNYTISKIESVFDSNTIKLRKTDDLIGVQMCGSIKNVIAIAAGILNGMGYQESTRAFLITEALHDIKALITELGGEDKTILSYAGVGDLLLTCTSTKSRNYSFGELVGRKASKDEINDYLSKNTVEGYYTLKSIYKLINDKHIEMPLIDLLYDILINYKDPSTLKDFLIEKK